MSLREDAFDIMRAAIAAASPAENTARILAGLSLPESVTVLSVGKASVSMAAAAQKVLGSRIKTGLLVTKYGHTGTFSSPYFEVIEASHPVSDENSVLAAERALEICSACGEKDTVLFLLSGGGSALLEKSGVPASVQRDITQKLLSRGAGIEEINAVRKRMSLVKGGRLAAAAYPARVVTVALSDVLSDDPGVIASGPTVADDTPDETVKKICRTYLSDVPENALAPLFTRETLLINDGGFYYAGNIRMLCDAAVRRAALLGYEAVCLTAALTGEAREQPARLLSQAGPFAGKRALICGGETTVTLRGAGKGGRNQEMALAAALLLDGKDNICFASVGSDGTDGPTDAAGGFADGGTRRRMVAAGLSPEEALCSNNAYYALKAAGDLIVTGPTGTNVNDLTLILTDMPASGQ